MYLKPAPKSKTHFSLELKTDVLDIYLEGEPSGGKKKNKSTYSENTVLDELTAMKDGRQENLREYSTTSKSGPHPSFTQIKGIFHQFINDKQNVGLK